MYNKILLGSIITVGAFLLSCQKTNNHPTQATTESSATSTISADNSSQARLTAKPNNYRVLFISRNRKICVCVGSGGNCLPDVIVKVDDSNDRLINNTINVINTGDTPAVHQFFIDNRTNLSGLLSSDCVTDVINGDLKAEAATDDAGTTNFLFFSDPNTNEVILAYPFTH